MSTWVSLSSAASELGQRPFLIDVVEDVSHRVSHYTVVNRVHKLQINTESQLYSYIRYMYGTIP